jgi:hypothetical protein
VRSGSEDCVLKSIERRGEEREEPQQKQNGGSSDAYKHGV